ncbi:7,8-dihydro-8-oxoguanine triphosphatase [Neolecta irregularis DAH-3]|uniref:Oxidized purine nucleoside triphosphate hydrolase n=1 Tax=Neolecta irregularis (strain DAH-3) TaxID=1198029 RepID=A0A1U7LNL4_NEOID|nr:7,8-dihydro-8-oxoguanine triphosphatase [Neolecta irregularis DAH-3]|eukprot:OLL24245.1 7,8-dihydro-8-oxoguanine triphosphatase [Neolecta irregularis DAH-3]
MSNSKRHLPVTLVLLFDRDKDQILLGLKKRGFGKNKWNGFGGKLVPGETVLQAAMREMEEESGVLVEESDMIKCALLKLENQNEVLEIHVFKAYNWRGNPIETEEMAPKWFSTKSIPYEDMWQEIRIWLPQVLAGKAIIFHALFETNTPELMVDDNWAVMTDYELEVVDFI